MVGLRNYLDQKMKNMFHKLGLRTRTNKEKLEKAIKNLDKNINSKAFFGGVPIAKIGSQSMNGAVFAMKMNNGSRKVLKIVKSPLGSKEFEFQENASKANIAPKVYKLKKEIHLTPNYKMFFLNKVNKINAFLMNNLENKGNKSYSLDNFLTRDNVSQDLKDKAVKILKSKVKKLGNLSIEHGNLHAENAYVILKSNGTIDVMIIDFGRARRQVGPRTRAVTAGRHGHRYGKNISKIANWHEPLYERKHNETPVILNANKMNALKKYSTRYA